MFNNLVYSLNPAANYVTISGHRVFESPGKGT